MKNLFIILTILILTLSGCITTNTKESSNKLLIEIVDTSKCIESVKEEDKEKENIISTMSVRNPNAELSSRTTLLNNKAYINIMSGLDAFDVIRMHNDVTILHEKGVKELEIFIMSGGGDAFGGIALADQIIRAKKIGIKVIGYASGIVASAAVPVFAVCSERHAYSGTIFMVHETSLWKWPGRESHSDIIAQGQLLEKLREKYLSYLVNSSNKTEKEWLEMETKTTWFSVEKAKEWGLVDFIE